LRLNDANRNGALIDPGLENGQNQDKFKKGRRRGHESHFKFYEAVQSKHQRLVTSSPAFFGLRIGPGPEPADRISDRLGFTVPLKNLSTAGRAWFDAAAARPDPIPVFAEMSSLNPVFILPGALRERTAQIAEGLRTSITMGVGQFCTKPGLVFGLPGAEFEQFQELLAGALTTAAPATMLHAGICESYHQGLAHMSAVNGVGLLARPSEPTDLAKMQGESMILRTGAAKALANR
jgi:hypothetical protein